MFRYIALTTILFAVMLSGTTSADSRSLLVVNGLGETLDRADLDSGTVTQNVATLGLFPNDVLVRGDRVCVINSGSDEIQLLDRTSFSSQGAVFLGGGRNPWSGAFLSDDTLYITNFVTSSLSKINLATQSVIAEIPVGDAVASDSPEGILIKDRRAFICLTSFDALFNYDDGKLEVYDLDADTLLKVVDMGINPQWLAEGYDGFLYIVATGNFADIEGWLYKFDPVALAKVDSLFIGGTPGSIAITKQGVAFLAAGGFGGRLNDAGKLPIWRGQGRRPEATADALAGGIIYTVDLNAWQLLHGPANPLETGFGVLDVVTVSDSTVATANFDSDTVTEIDSAGTILQTFPVGDGPTALAKSPACFITKGDADCNGTLSIGDAVFIISYIFGGGPESPVAGAADADCSGAVSIGDAVYLINFIFGGGPLCGECAD